MRATDDITHSSRHIPWHAQMCSTQTAFDRYAIKFVMFPVITILELICLQLKDLNANLRSKKNEKTPFHGKTNIFQCLGQLPLKFNSV